MLKRKTSCPDGISAALLTNAIAEKDRKEREHQKEIKELKDEIRKLRGR